jgi:hypothetical protein
MQDITVVLATNCTDEAERCQSPPKKNKKQKTKNKKNEPRKPKTE